MVGILLSSVKEQNINTCSDMDGSQKYHVNWFLPAWKTYTIVTPLTDLFVWVGAHTCMYACVVWTSDMASSHFLPQILCARSSSAWTVLLPDSSPLLSLPSGLCSHVAYERGFPLTIPYKT